MFLTFSFPVDMPSSTSGDDDAPPRTRVGWLLLALARKGAGGGEQGDFFGDAARAGAALPPVFLALEGGRTVLKSDDG